MRLAAGLVFLAGCGGDGVVPPGDRENGRLLLRQFGCGQCWSVAEMS